MKKVLVVRVGEGGSRGLRKEAVSITQKCKVKQQVLMQELQQVIQKIWKRCE